ncbi:hypothetical protein [Streptomyces sp. CC210A]|uniref:hypothetical protein n=1 Tax=Streptomyces sp. CC210A TaxID=2898184 RepID=UPI001F352200|nr:hypothetical protein [Streptomyces sp. CC210A]
MISMQGKRGLALTAIAGALALATVLGAFTWWNTNVFGDEELCGGKLRQSELDSVLDTRGRISSTSAAGGDGIPEFRCSVQRTSRFMGAQPMEISVNTAVHEPDFPFQSRVWRGPAAMTYFTAGVPGAVSEDRGWVALPRTCQGKAGFIAVGSRRLPDADEVTVVEAVMNRGKADRAVLAQLLLQAAGRVAADAGCASNDMKAAAELGKAPSTSTTDPRAVCGVAGFALPSGAVDESEARVDRETVAAGDQTWACDLHLAGSAEGQISFSTSSDAHIVEGPMNAAEGFEPLPEGKGRIDGYNRAVLNCRSGKVYFGMRQDDAYKSLLLQQDGERYTKTSQAQFQSFLDSAGARHGCPSVAVPLH